MTSFEALLGTEFPLIQAPMAGVQDSKLAIAVSNAGGLGSLPCALFSTDQMRKELTALAKTNKPYSVNFFCHSTPTPNAEEQEKWKEVLSPYYSELGIDKSSINAGPGRAAFGEEQLAVLKEFRPPVVTFHFGLPSDDLLVQIRSWGAKIFSSATTVEEAKWLEARGVDAVIAQGLEAGGHRGHFLHSDLTLQMPTFCLLPQIVKAVKIPVIAAGGISNSQTVLSALLCGAAAVQVGTGFLLCPESLITRFHREALKNSSSSSHTVLTNIFTGRPARGLITRFIREVGPMSNFVPQFPLAVGASAPLRAKAEEKGNADFSPLWSGQNPSDCKEIPAAELVRELMADWTRHTLAYCAELTCFEKRPCRKHELKERTVPQARRFEGIINGMPGPDAVSTGVRLGYVCCGELRSWNAVDVPTALIIGNSSFPVADEGAGEYMARDVPLHEGAITGVMRLASGAEVTVEISVTTVC